jgi:hypothetical protein
VRNIQYVVDQIRARSAQPKAKNRQRYLTAFDQIGDLLANDHRNEKQ